MKYVVPVVAMIIGGAIVWTATQLQLPARAQPVPVVELVEVAPETNALCEEMPTWMTRESHNITLEVPNPPAAMMQAQAILSRLEAQTVYANSSGIETTASLNAKVPVGTQTDWAETLALGHVSSINSSESSMGDEIRQLCTRLDDLIAAEDILMVALESRANRAAVTLMLEMHRNDLRNTEQRLNSLREEARFAQVYIHFNPVP
jgi:hypothetical protein